MTSLLKVRKLFNGPFLTSRAPNKNKMEMVAKLKAARKRYKKRKNAFISHNTKQSVMRQVMTGEWRHL